MDGFRVVKIDMVVKQIDILITCTGMLLKPNIVSRNAVNQAIISVSSSIFISKIQAIRDKWIMYNYKEFCLKYLIHWSMWLHFCRVQNTMLCTHIWFYIVFLSTLIPVTYLCENKVVSNSPGLVDFAMGLVNSVLTCLTGKWCFLGNSNNRRTVKSILLVKPFLGLFEMMSGLVNASFILPEWQAVKMIFFAPCWCE